MKKSAIFILTATILLTLSACGKTTKPVDTDAPIVTAQPENTSISEPTDQPEIEQSNEPLVVIDGNTITIKDDKSGTDEKSNGMEKLPILTNRNIGYSGEAGPIIYKVTGIQVSSLIATDDSTASMLGLEKNVPGSLVAIEMTVENTSKDDVSFYPYMSTIITNTKEQVESNWILSDSVGGDFLGEVEKSGQIYWICNSDASEISHIQWRIDSPHDNNYDHFGNEIKIEIDLIH